MQLTKTYSSSSKHYDLLFQQVIDADDETAFSKLFGLFNRQLYTFCLPIVTSKELAEEVVCDVFFNLWRNRKSISIDTSLKAYIYTSVRNKALDYVRKIKRDRSIDLDKALHIPYAEESPDEKIDNQQLAATIQCAINSLPQQCRQVFLLNREKGMKYREIAEHLNISIKTVETHMGRALKHLRSCIPETAYA